MPRRDLDAPQGRTAKRTVAAGFGFALTVPLAATAAAMPPPDSGAPSPTTTVGPQTSAPEPDAPSTTGHPTNGGESTPTPREPKPVRATPPPDVDTVQQGLNNKRHAVNVATGVEDPTPARAPREPRRDRQPRERDHRPQPRNPPQPAQPADAPSPAAVRQIQQGYANKRHAMDVATGQPQEPQAPPQPAQPADAPSPAAVRQIQQGYANKRHAMDVATSQPQETPAQPEPKPGPSPAEVAVIQQGYANKRHAMDVVTQPAPQTRNVKAPRRSCPDSSCLYGLDASIYNHLPEDMQTQVQDRYRDFYPDGQYTETGRRYRHTVPAAEYDGPLTWNGWGSLLENGLDGAGGYAFTGKAKGQFLGGKGKRKAYPGLGGSLDELFTVSFGRSDEHVDENGDRTVSVSASMSLKTQGSVSYGGKVIDAEGHVYTGSSYGYTIMVDPDRADEVTSGDAEAPNPLAPDTFEDGDGVELGNEDSHGWGYSAQYRGVGAGEDFGESSGQTGGVQRVDEDTMRIYVGDHDAVSRALSLRLGSGKAGLSVSLGSMEYTHSGLTAVDLDMSTPEGRKAYREFLSSGQTPRVNGPEQPGVVDASTSRQLTAEAGPAGVDVGPIHWTIGESSYRGTQSRAHHADDTVDRVIEIRDSDVTMRSYEQIDPDGSAGDTSYTLSMKDVDGADLEQYYGFTGQDAENPGDHDAVLRLSADQLMQLRDDVVQTVSADSQQTNQPMTPEEVDAAARANEDYPTTQGVNYQQGILMANTPREMMIVLLNESQGSGGGVLYTIGDIKRQLGRLGEDRGGSPGTLDLYDN